MCLHAIFTDLLADLQSLLWQLVLSHTPVLVQHTVTILTTLDSKLEETVS
jgi:hypothetical protein